MSWRIVGCVLFQVFAPGLGATATARNPLSRLRSFFAQQRLLDAAPSVSQDLPKADSQFHTLPMARISDEAPPSLVQTRTVANVNSGADTTRRDEASDVSIVINSISVRESGEQQQQLAGLEEGAAQKSTAEQTRSIETLLGATDNDDLVLGATNTVTSELAAWHPAE
mmetsp:Transcript_41955/g.66614  ORF Transcript_41955/g.66614 Transcript_41955/m.66614 type:complete len:168 (+) Transcript_41955:52-555(+)